MGSSFETVTGDANPLSDVYIVQTKSPDDVSRVAKEAKAIQGVDNANFGGSDTEILMATMKRVQFWGIIATALFNYCSCPIDFKYHPYLPLCHVRLKFKSCVWSVRKTHTFVVLT
ncbi:FtsX [Streptococcus thermophilus CNCM I-1630]|nr:FtsX [Streptococcus thermophilus CNCM I-1630]